MATLTCLRFLKLIFASVAFVASRGGTRMPEVIEVNKGINHGSSTLGLKYASFKMEPFFLLNITYLGADLLDSESECGYACLETPSCFSYNVAAFPDINGKLLCELLPSDMYNNTEKLIPNKGHHHFSIASQCSSWPCKNKGKCVSLYEENSYVCVCEDGFTGKNCETDVNECQSNPCLNNGTCVDMINGFNCSCPPGFVGNRCLTAFKSCAEVYKVGRSNISGVYKIDPDGLGEFEVFCDQKTAGGGWTVFQRRQDGSVDFYRGWYDYKYGFGNLSGEFWLGLDKTHRLTVGESNKLRVDLEDFNNNTAFAEYSSILVANEMAKYQLTLGSYGGTAGDSMSYHSGSNFTTKDCDNDRYGGNCALAYKGAFWYKHCHRVNLNGKYLPGTSRSDAVVWSHWGHYYSLKKTEMNIRPKSF